MGDNSSNINIRVEGVRWIMKSIGVLHKVHSKIVIEEQNFIWGSAVGLALSLGAPTKRSFVA